MTKNVRYKREKREKVRYYSYVCQKLKREVEAGKQFNVHPGQGFHTTPYKKTGRPRIDGERHERHGGSD